MKKIVFFCIATLLFTACKDDVNLVPDHLSLVYPQDEGLTRFYEVDATIYETSSGNPEDESYYIREEQTGFEEDLGGTMEGVIYRYRGVDSITVDSMPTISYSFDETWTQAITDDYFRRNEGNIPVLIMPNPALNDRTWNHNLFNNREVRRWVVLNNDTTWTVNGMTFNNCVYVGTEYREPAGDINGTFFQFDEAYEVYAPNVGRIERYFYEVEIQNGRPLATNLVLHERLLDFTKQ